MTEHSFLDDNFSSCVLDCMFSDDIKGLRQLVDTANINKNNESTFVEKETTAAFKFVEKNLLSPWLRRKDTGFTDEIVVELLRLIKFTTQDCLILLYESNEINAAPLFQYLLDNDLILKTPNIDVSTILDISMSMDGGCVFSAHVLSRVMERIDIDENHHLVTIAGRLAKKLCTNFDFVHEVSKLFGGLSAIDAWMKTTLQRSKSNSFSISDLILLNYQGFSNTAKMHAATFNHSFTGNQLIMAENVLGLNVSNERLSKMFSTGSLPKYAAAINYIFNKSTDEEFARHLSHNTIFRDAQDFSGFIVKMVNSYKYDGMLYDNKSIASRIDAALQCIDQQPHSNFKLTSDHHLVQTALLRLPAEIVQESNRLKRMLLSEDLGM
jgi:hypothetical protein